MLESDVSYRTDEKPQDGIAATDRPGQTACATPPLAAPGSSSGNRLFWIGAGVFVVLKLVLMAGLPLVVSYDSMHYLDLSETYDGTRTWDQWHYGRVPAYPYYLWAVGKVLGLTPGSYITSNTIMGTITALLLAWLLRVRVGPIPALVLLVLMLMHPLIVGYEHVLLTEVITGCLLAIIMAVSCPQAPWAWGHYVLLGSIVGLAYMTRQNYLAMLAPALVVSALLHRKPRRTTAAIVLALVLGTAGFTGMMARWSAREGPHKHQGAGFLLFIGVCNYGLVDTSIPEFVPAREAYEKILKELPPAGDAGYGDLHILPIRRIAEEAFPNDCGRIAWKSVLASPPAYLKAVGRNLRLLYGFADVQGENANWPLVGMRKNYGDGNVRVGPHYDEKARALFAQPFQRGAVGRGYRNLVDPHNTVFLLAAGLSFFGMMTMLARKDWVPAILNFIPHYLLLGYAVLLTGIDRYAIPMYPAMLFSGLWSAWYLGGLARNRLLHRASPATPDLAGWGGSPGVHPATCKGPRVLRVILTVLAILGLQLFANLVLQPWPSWLS
jgi:hypothetical protein